MAEQQVRINGKLFLYRQKAPFVASGCSVLGAIEYDAEEDKIRCHECGEWFQALPPHIGPAHGLSPRGYKQKHGLLLKAALVCERLREGSSRRAVLRVQCDSDANLRRLTAMRGLIRSFGSKWEATPEVRNENGRCRAQILLRLRAVAERLGRTPTQRDLRDAGLSYGSVLSALKLRDLPSAMTLAGLMPREQGVHLDGQKGTFRYSREVLIELIRDFYVASGRLPSSSDMRRVGFPGRETFDRHFGSWKKAVESAGFGRLAKKLRGKYQTGVER